MKTAYISHPACHHHDTGPQHPECAARLSAIEDLLMASGLADFLSRVEAPRVTREQLLRVHGADYVETLRRCIPEQGFALLDMDTVISRDSLTAAEYAAGAVVHAVDLVLGGAVRNAFCAVRPPGHHAESNQAMGFCLFNNIGVGAAHALEAHGLSRIAIVDFDVHQGNGTEDMLIGDDRVLYCSVFEHPFYPFTQPPENGDRVVSVPLEATAGSAEFRAAVNDHWLPALRRFEPEMVFVSTGFDGHADDDMSHLSLTDADFQWVTQQIVTLADAVAGGRLVSVLEGGYELHSLARCTRDHLRVMMGLD